MGDWSGEWRGEAEVAAAALLSELRGLGGPFSPARINSVFRRAHSLKGIARMAEAEALAGLAHQLEDLLDGARLGRLSVEGEGAALLREAGEVAVALAGAPEDPGMAARAGVVGARMAGLLSSAGAAPEILLPLESALTGRLSDDERERASRAWGRGAGLALIRVGLPLDGLAGALEALDRALELRGSERIATLPGGRGSADALTFDILCTAPSGAEDAWTVRILVPAAGVSRSDGGNPVELAGGSVPLRWLFDRAARWCAAVARECEKDVVLLADDGALAVDAATADDLSSCLLHLVRNAVDHGVEPNALRRELGKALPATLRLLASRDGDVLVVALSDDGAGVDEARLGAAVIEKGLCTPDGWAALDRAERLALLFAPGLTTRRQVGMISGRGVGLDVVRHHVELLGGAVLAESTPGLGTRFVLRLGGRRQT